MLNQYYITNKKSKYFVMVVFMIDFQKLRDMLEFNHGSFYDWFLKLRDIRI